MKPPGAPGTELYRHRPLSAPLLLSKWLHEWRESLLCSLESNLSPRYEPCGFWFRSRRHVAAVVFVVVNHVIIVIASRYSTHPPIPFYSSLFLVLLALYIMPLSPHHRRGTATLRTYVRVSYLRASSSAIVDGFLSSSSRIDRSRRHQAPFLFVSMGDGSS